MAYPMPVSVSAPPPLEEAAESSGATADEDAVRRKLARRAWFILPTAGTAGLATPSVGMVVATPACAAAAPSHELLGEARDDDLRGDNLYGPDHAAVRSSARDARRPISLARPSGEALRAVGQ